MILLTQSQDEIFQIGDDSTRVLNFASPLESGSVYNVYKNGVRLDDPILEQVIL